MSNWPQKPRNDDSNDDKPPYSRLFIVCSKQITVDDLRSVFEPYGEIENIYLPKDRNTGELKGVAYIKYTKTSAAALAIEGRHLTTLENTNKPMKVMVASNKGMLPSYENKHENEDKYKRLFIKVSRDETEQNIRDHFSEFGRLESVHLQRNKLTDESKGFAYVNYKSFLDAAKAYEQCDRKYKPIFATPKDELKRNRNSLDSFNDSFHLHNSFHKDSYHNHPKDVKVDRRDSFSSLIKTAGQNFDTVIVICKPPVYQKCIEKLCNIIPGVMFFKFTTDAYNGYCKATVTYNCEKSAAFAVERLNNFEFPSGEVVTVKPDDSPLTKVATNLSNLVNSFKSNMDGNPDLMQLAEAMAQASNLIKAATVARDDNEINCSVPLPPVQPMADAETRVAQRCFLVFKPHPPPLPVIKDAFCRFGNLIDISTFPNKTFGFAKYASITSAQDAIKTLHEATLNGIRVKVFEADEKYSKESNNMNVDDEDNLDAKRKKYDQN